MARITKIIRNMPVKKSKIVAWGLTWFQLGLLALAIIVGIITFFLLFKKVSINTALIICFIEMGVIIVVGLVRPYNMNFLHFIYSIISRTSERYYYNDINNFDIKEDTDMKKSTLFKKEKAVNIPKSAQDVIPFVRVLENGIIQVTDKVYALAFRFDDIDYKQMSLSQKESVFNQYQTILNELPPYITYQEYITNIEVCQNDYISALMPKIDADMPAKEQELFTDFGEILKNKVAAAYTGTAKKDKIIVLSYSLVTSLDNFNSLEEAYLTIRNGFKKFGSETTRLDSEDILKLFYKLYNPFSTLEFLHPTNIYRTGKNIKSYIAPSVFEFKNNYIVCGDAYMSVLYMLTAEAEGQMTDDYISDLLDNGYHITVSKIIRRIDKKAAMSALKNEYSNAINEKGRSEKENTKTGETGIAYGVETNVIELKKQLDDLNKAENQLFDVELFVGIAAESLEELKEIESLLIEKGTIYETRLARAKFNQRKALNSLAPVAYSFFDETSSVRNKLISDAATVFMPFSTRLFFSPNGICYGIDSVSGNLVVLDRTEDINANGFVIGSSGGGKSFFSKFEDLSILSKYPNDVIWVMDPDGEYSKILNNVSGECIKLSPNSPNKINIFDVSIEAVNNATFDISTKIEFICAVIETMKRSPLSLKELGLISSVVTEIYAPFMKSRCVDDIPDIDTFCTYLKKRNEQEAQDLYLGLNFYLSASDSFLKGRTNISLNKRYTIIDISECKGVWRSVAMQVILSMFDDKMVEMRKQGVRCWLKADEFHSFFVDENGRETPRSIAFFQNAFRRGRKMKCVMQGITQNFSDLLRSPQAMNMLANATFLVIFRQKADDLKKVAETFHLTDEQENYLRDSGAGEGIIIAHGKTIRFKNTIEANTLVYKLLETSSGKKAY